MPEKYSTRGTLILERRWVACVGVSSPSKVRLTPGDRRTNSSRYVVVHGATFCTTPTSLAWRAISLAFFFHLLGMLNRACVLASGKRSLGSPHQRPTIVSERLKRGQRTSNERLAGYRLSWLGSSGAIRGRENGKPEARIHSTRTLHSCPLLGHRLLGGVGLTRSAEVLYISRMSAAVSQPHPGRALLDQMRRRRIEIVILSVELRFRSGAPGRLDKGQVPERRPPQPGNDLGWWWHNMALRNLGKLQYLQISKSRRVGRGLRQMAPYNGWSVAANGAKAPLPVLDGLVPTSGNAALAARSGALAPKGVGGGV